LLLHPHLAILPLTHGLRVEVVGNVELRVLQRLEVAPERLLGAARVERGRGGDERKRNERAYEPRARGTSHARSVAQPSSGAEAGDDSSPAAHIFAAGGTAEDGEPPRFSADAGGTSLAAAFPHRPWGGTPTRDIMDDNAGNLIRSLRQKLSMT